MNDTNNQARDKRTVLDDVIESMTDGFALFDAADRLVICNAQFKALYPKICESIVPGVHFDELVKFAEERDEVVQLCATEGGALSGSRSNPGANGSRTEYETRDGRWIEIRDYWIEGGGRISVRADTTERKRSEEVGRYFTSIVESSSEAIIGKTLEGEILSWNAAAERIYGYTADEVLGKNVMILVPPDRESEVPHLLGRVRDGERIKEFETVRRRNDGALIDVSLTLSPIRDESGAVTGVSTIARDNTERKRSEERLEAARVYSENIVETVREPLIVLDRSYRVVWANQSFYDFFEVEPEETENALFFEIGNRQWNNPELRGQLEQILPSRTELQDLVFTQDFPSIGCKTMHLNARAIQERDGRRRLILLTVEDITERKRAEESLFQEKERAEVTLKSIGDAVITTDAQGYVQYLNPVAESLTGWVVDEARGQSLERVFHIIDERNRERAPDPVAQCLSENRVTVLGNYTILVRRDGEEFAIQDSAAPIRGRQGELLGVVLVFSDETEARRMAQQIAHQATHDALTGLVNRGEFEQRLRRVLEATRSREVEHALCYLDLDQFKVINDTCGHVAGDELLRQLGTLLRARVSERDTLARLGGDEFGVLMEHCPLKQARRVANVLREAVEEFRFAWDGKSFSIGVSIGLVPITADSEGMKEVLSAADTACYTAKDKGRNRIHVYRVGDAELVRRRGEMQWVARINRAIEEDRFHLCFQPIVPVEGDGEGGDHYELLLRMRDEEGRSVRPGSFFPAAERYDLASKIDRWVIRTAFEWLTYHREQLERLYLCEINLSGHSLGDTNFLKLVIHQFDDSNIPPQKICFEVTETAAIANFTNATQFMQTLKGLGCRFALDDFGSGLSSFAYLKNLPVDFLKIDGMFVKGIFENPIDLAVVRSINEIGQAMGKRTIAEFVENESILEKLKLGEIGVDYAQGYGIGRPRPLEEMA